MSNTNLTQAEANAIMALEKARYRSESAVLFFGFRRADYKTTGFS